jgi:hypothetical protein
MPTIYPGTLDVITGPNTTLTSSFTGSQDGFGIIQSLSDSMLSISGSNGAASFILPKGMEYKAYERQIAGSGEDTMVISNLIRTITVHNGGTVLVSRVSGYTDTP